MFGLVEKVIGIIAPDNCIICDAEEALICSWCRVDACVQIPSQCYKCQKQTVDFAVCEGCRRASPVSHVWMATEYDEIASELVKQLKFGYKRAGAATMAYYMDQLLPYLPSQTIVMPIPTSSKRVRERGFDHAQLLAGHVAKSRKLAHQRLLHRHGHVRQVGAKRQQRLKQLEGAFWVSGSVKGKTILLVDDVVTTGSTIETAAKVLKKAGAAQVNAIVFAQAK